MERNKQHDDRKKILIAAAILNNMEKKKGMSETAWRSSKHWQGQCSDQDWSKWEKVAKDIEKAFTDGGQNEPFKGEQVRHDSSVFEVKLDVQSFAPEELQVKVSGNTLTVKGKHGRKVDEYGSVSREFHREFNIPEDVKMDTFESSVTDEGILTLRADVEGGVKRTKRVDIKFET